MAKCSLIFRGVKIRGGKWIAKTGEHHIHLEAAISKPVADYYDWDGLVFAPGSESCPLGARKINLRGESVIKEFALKPNGNEATAKLGFSATAMMISDFKASFSEPKEPGGAIDGELQFVLTIGSGVMDRFERYVAAIGVDGTAQMRVELIGEKQMKIGEDQEAEVEEESPEEAMGEESFDEDPNRPVLATLREMKAR